MRILIVIIISVTLFAFQPIQNNKQDQQINNSIERVVLNQIKQDIVNQIDLNSQIINKKVQSLFEFNEINQNHSQESSQIINNQESIHSVQYQLDKLDDDQFSQKSSSQNNLIYTQQFLEQQPIQSNHSIHQSRLTKHIQIQQIELNQQFQTSDTILLNKIPKVQEKNPLKLLLLYSNNTKQQNKDDNQHQIPINNNELIQDKLEREKKEKIIKMQSLIIEQLKDKKIEPKKEENFFEQDFIEYSMKTLINNNNLRGK